MIDESEDLLEAEEFDDSDYKDAPDGHLPDDEEDTEIEVEQDPAGADRKRQALMLMERLVAIKSKEDKDWYQSLFAVALDDQQGDWKSAIAQADEMFKEHPKMVPEAIEDAYLDAQPKKA